MRITTIKLTAATLAIALVSATVMVTFSPAEAGPLDFGPRITSMDLGSGR